jgi:hypothetical protein
MGMEWAARQFYSLPSIIERMARSRTGLWWNIARNLGYHLALRNFGNVGFNPECVPGEHAESPPPPEKIKPVADEQELIAALSQK